MDSRRPTRTTRHRSKNCRRRSRPATSGTSIMCRFLVRTVGGAHRLHIYRWLAGPHVTRRNADARDSSWRISPWANQFDHDAKLDRAAGRWLHELFAQGRSLNPPPVWRLTVTDWEHLPGTDSVRRIETPAPASTGVLPSSCGAARTATMPIGRILPPPIVN